MNNQMRATLQKLFDTRLTAVLSTVANNEPYLCLVSYAVTEDLRQIVFSTKRDRKKYRDMVNNPRISLMIDDRRNLPEDVNRVMSVTVVGNAAEAKGREKTTLAHLLSKRHPVLSEFVESGDTAIMHVTIERLYVVTNFESVLVIG